MDTLIGDVPLEGWTHLPKVVVETTMSWEWEHQMNLCRIAMEATTSGPILSPDGQMAPTGPWGGWL